jgi:hypothetical protein
MKEAFITWVSTGGQRRRGAGEEKGIEPYDNH